jgi:hypothetical protein
VRGDKKKSKGLFEVIPGWVCACVHVFHLSLFVSRADYLALTIWAEVALTPERYAFHPKAQPDH